MLVHMEQGFRCVQISLFKAPTKNKLTMKISQNTVGIMREAVGQAVFSPDCLRIAGHYPFQSESISATIPSNLKAYRPFLLCSLFAFH